MSASAGLESNRNGAVSVPHDWSWGSLPIGRVVHLVGAPAEGIRLSVDPLPDAGPAIVQYTVGHVTSAASVVEPLLDELEYAARQLFPAWLPGAEEIDGESNLDVAAVHALASSLAATTHHFGPFVAALAEAALHDEPVHTHFARETRASGLARVIADSYRRQDASLLISGPPDLGVDAQNAVAAACQWFAEHGDFGVWLVGELLPAVDTFQNAAVHLTADILELFNSKEAHASPQVEPGFRFAALQGTAHGLIEKTVERALSLRPWAKNRNLNYRYHATLLHSVKILDIVWLDEKCVVEIDGPEHFRGAMRMLDERRDKELHQDGFRVLRVANWDVESDLTKVISTIEEFLRTRRAEMTSSAPCSVEGTKK